MHTFFRKHCYRIGYFQTQNPRRLQNEAKTLLKCHNYSEDYQTTVAIPGKLQAVVTPYNIYMVH